MTVDEAAAVLEVTPATVYSLCKAGRIVHERHGLGRGTIRIRQEDLEAYRQSVRAGGGAASSPARRARPVGLKHFMRGER